MSSSNSTLLKARGWVTIVCFAIVIFGQAWLLRNKLTLSEIGPLPAYYYGEFFFILLLIIGIIINCVRSTGWGNGIGRKAALGLVAAYAAYSVYFYKQFAEAYLTGFEANYASVGSALIALKLVIVTIGVVAGIPVAPRINDREYSRRLREKVQRQDAEWAKAAVKGSSKELKETVEKLRGSLSEEEFAELLADISQQNKEKADETETPKTNEKTSQ